MEGGDQPTSRNAASNGGSRWNPTNEQITYLEEKYRQGLRTPTAEEIHTITEELKAHGKIEGKNVFYWFQNHKARQRQKQKQQQPQMFGYYSRVHHHQQQRMNNPPLLLPAAVHHQNAMCNSSLPYYIAPSVKRDQSCLYPKVPLPPAAPVGRLCSKKSRPIEHYQQKQQPAPQRYNPSMQEPTTCKNPHVVETLELFPIHPTGILQSENVATDSNYGNESGSSSKNPNCPSGDWCDHNIGNIDCTARDGHVALIDFFACGNN